MYYVNSPRCVPEQPELATDFFARRQRTIGSSEFIVCLSGQRLNDVSRGDGLGLVRGGAAERFHDRA